MNKERLLKLADFVEANVIQEKFNMATFFSRNVQKLEDMNNCGTTACLAGWACTIPEFKEEGFEAVRYDATRPDLGLVVNYQGLTMFNALQAFFNLSNSQALYLFGEYADEDETIERGREDVHLAIKRLRDFANTGEMNWEESDPAYDEDEED